MPAHVLQATVCPSGKMLVVEFADGAGGLTNLLSANYATTETARCDGAAGTYTLTLAGHTTAPLARSAGSAAVQAALEALTGIGAGNVVVLGIPGRFLIRFAGALAAVPQALLSVDASGLLATGPTPPTTAGTSPYVPIDANSGSPGYVVTGDWLAGGFGGKKFPSSGTGANYATWTFTGLAPGLYRVAAVWDVDAQNTTAAKYRFFDGSNYRGSAVVNQTVDRTADNPDGTQTLKAVYVGGGTLTVYLADDTTGFIRANLVSTYPTSAASAAVTESVAGASAFVAQGGDVTAKLNGSPLPLAGAYWHPSNYNGDPFNKPYVSYPTSGTTIRSTDSVSVSVPDGVFTTEAGVISAGVTDLAATNKAGDTLLPPLPGTPRTLRMGYNLGLPAPYPVGMYANLMKSADGWLGTPGVDYYYGPNSNGYPSFTAAGKSVLCTVVSGGGNIADPRAYPSSNFGLYTLLWDSDGTGDVEIRQGNGVIATLVSSDTGHATNNKKVYNLQPDPSVVPTPYFAGFTCVISSTAAGTPATNVRIHPPDVDASNPPKFRPSFVAQCQGSKVFRTMVALGANNSSISRYSDYPSQSQRSYYAVDNRSTSYNIVTIGPFTDTSNFVPHGQLGMLVTLDHAHDITDGEIVIAYPAPGVPLTVTQHGGQSTQFDYYGLVAFYDPAQMTDHQIVIWNGVTGGVPTYVDPVYTAGGRIVTDNSAAMPPEDYIDIINLVDDCDAYINVPHAATDAMVTQLFTMIRDRLAPGRKVYCELANEHWNFGPGFSQYQYFQALGQQLGGDGTAGYTVRSGHVHAVARAALGVRASDYRAAFGSFTNIGSVTASIFEVAQAHSPPIPVDVLLLAAYTGVPNNETDPAITATAASLDVDQLMDLFERYMLTDYEAKLLAGHKAIINSLSPSTEFMLYEGAFSTGHAGGDTLTRAKQSQAASHHPRLTRSMMHYFQRIQDRAGVAAFAYYAQTHEYANESSTNVTVYGAFQGWNVLPGPNDGTGAGGHDARPDIAGVPPGPADLSRDQSVIAKSIVDWNSGATPGTVGPGTGGETGIPLAAAPLAAGIPTSSSVPLSFGVVSGGTAPYFNQPQRSFRGAATWADSGSAVPGLTAVFTASGLTPATPYDFRVRTTDSAGTPAVVYSGVISATTAAGSSGGSTLAAGTLAAGSVTSTTVALTFATLTGGTAPYSSQLQSLHGSGIWTNMGSPAAGATASYTASGLSASTQYDFRIVTTDSAAATVTSNAVTVTTAAGPGGGGTRAPRVAFRLPRA